MTGEARSRLRLRRLRNDDRHLVSAGGVICPRRHRREFAGIVAIEPRGLGRKLVQARRPDRLIAVSAQAVLSERIGHGPCDVHSNLQDTVRKID